MAISDKDILSSATEITISLISNGRIDEQKAVPLLKDYFVKIKNFTDGNETENDLIPAVPIKNSVTADFLICLEDGKKFKSLRRHIRTSYNLSPEEYREKWSLPHDYPMVAPNYAAARSRLAKKMGLGKKQNYQSPAFSEPIIAN